MGSLAGYRWGEWGYQETPIHLRIGETPEAQIWINHPGERLHSGFGRPSYWGGCGTLPRVQQYRGLAIVLFRVHEGQPDFSHAWLPQRYFDDVRCYDKRILLRSGKGMVQISGNRAFQRIAHGPTQHCEVRLPGQETCWLIRLNDDPRLDNLADFEARFAQLTVERREDDTIYVNDPQYGEVFFQPNGCVFGQGRLLDPDSWTISGDSHELPL